MVSLKRHGLKGSALFELGRHEEAIEAYNKAIEIDDKFKEVWFNKGTALFELGRNKEAIEAYNKAIEIDGNFKEAWVNKGNTLLELGRNKEAVKACEKAIEIDDELKEAWLKKGNGLFKLGRNKEAIEAYNKAIEIDDEYKEAWVNKGNVLGRMGNYEDSIDAFERAIEINDEYKETWFNKGISLYELKKYEDAIKAYDKAIGLDVEFKEAWFNKGDALFELGRKEDALEAYDKAIEIDDKYKEAWKNKGIALWILGYHEEAIKVINKRLNLSETISEDINLIFNKGQILSILKREWEANQCFTEALRKCKGYLWYNGSDVYFWELKGQIQIALENFRGATNSLKKAIGRAKKNDRSDSDFYSTLGRTYLYRGKYDKAIKACKDATTENPNNIDAWLIKATALYERGKYNELSEVEYCLKRIIDIAPESAQVYSYLSELYFDLGNTVMALEMADEALRYKSELIAPLLIKAKILVEKKLYNEALQVLNTANSVESGDIRLQLWELYVQYLQLTYKKGNEEKQKDKSDSNYKEELGSIIRKLERLNTLAAKVEKPERNRLQGQLLYLLANFYLKNDDIYSAKDRLESCLKVAKGDLKRSAKGLLSNIWNRLIKPKWWSWWLNSPVYRWTRRIIFGSVSTFLLLLFGLSTVDITNLSNSTLLNSKVLKEILNIVNPEIPMTMFISSFLIFVLIMPSIISFKAKDFEIELHNLSSYDPTLSPSSIEETIKSLSPKLPESPLYSMPKPMLDEKFIKSEEGFFNKNMSPPPGQNIPKLRNR